jgi:hypothetical protein
MSSTKRNRPLGIIVFLIGAAAGAVAFVVAKLLIPAKVSNASAHDLHLARNIGFVLPGLMGLCLGCMDGALRRMLIGVFGGSITGLAYARLCGSEFHFLEILLLFPCVCGGLLAALVGSENSPWLRNAPLRFAKGMLAGLVCGAVYTLVLNVLGALMLPWFVEPNLADFGAMMWKAGPPALALGGGFFLVLLRWAVHSNQRTEEA